MTLAFLADRVPNEEAIALAPTIGWLMLAAAVCVATIFIVHREAWRRLWLRAEDPRTMGAFRIAFGLCTLCNINGLWELFEYLFTDEGLFLTDVARHVYAAEQFQGFGNGLDGDPYGFFGFAGFWQWLKGPRYSLLFFNSSPAFFWTHLAAFEIAMACVIVGFQTRWTKWVAWFLFHSIILRNTVYWEGTENVYRTFFFYLCLSRCDRAYSVDNWLRCRRLRKAGRLSEPGLPGDGTGAAPSEDHPYGLQAIYRNIPAWPRLLVILQSAAIYCYTGAVKNGGVWWSGDAFYYAFSLDHFHRVPPQTLAAWFGTSLFRINTHVAHAWETLFPLVVLGLVVRWGLRQHIPISRAARRLAALSWWALGLLSLAIVLVAYPVHFVDQKDSWWTLQRAQGVFATGWIGLMLLVAWGWWRLRHRPFELRWRGRTVVIDLDRFLTWTCGRRMWLAVGVIFHLHLTLLMNIGWFSPGCLAGFICFLNGSEVVLIGRAIGRRLRLVPADRPIVGPEDPSLPHLRREATALPLGVIVACAVAAVVGVALQVFGVLHFGWTLVGIATFLLGVTLRRPRRPHTEEPGWAYGPVGRLLIGSLTLYHVVGVAAWLLPDKDCLIWRTKAHESFRFWLETTQTTQGWKMFAPNPPRSNLFLQVIVVDANGDRYDLNTDVYHPSQRPIPWIFYTRQRKINRRIAGGEGGKGEWYQRWEGRYYCRQWALEHDGVLPHAVELVKITYPIPTPEDLAKEGPYDPAERLAKKGSHRALLTVECAEEVEAQLTQVVSDRHGLPRSQVPVIRWGELRGKKARWEAKLAKEREAERDEESDPEGGGD